MRMALRRIGNSFTICKLAQSRSRFVFGSFASVGQGFAFWSVTGTDS
jgi:hypothetical protein